MQNKRGMRVIMDEKKLIETLNIVKDYNREKVHYEAPYLDSENMEIIEEALEKQLPKKPIEVVGAIYSNSYECKYCGNELEPQDMFGEYCKWCGQKL